jgi:hypothetical protein
MIERRYTEEEVEAIFRQAAEAEVAGKGPLPAGEGRTLSELQAIGAEVGLQPELVERAARSLDRGGRPPDRSLLGFPLAVGRTVALERRLTDEEWERLVVDLRDTFDARGTLRTQGTFRQWTNGNLQALLEPTERGHQLRLRTLKGDARNFMHAGLALFGVALALLVLFAATGELATDWGAAFFVALMGAGMFGAGALRLPGWAATREAQMDGVVERLLASTSSDPDDRDGTS